MNQETFKEHEAIRKLMTDYGYVEGRTFNITQTDNHIRVNMGGAVEPAFLKEFERLGFEVLFLAADFPTGMFVAVAKQED